MIRIPISFLRDGDKVSLLPDADQTKGWQAAIRAGLASADRAVQAEAAALEATLALCEEAAASPAAVHLVAVFRDPEWRDKPALYAEALRMAEEAGSRDAVNAFLLPLRVTKLLDHVEDPDGQRSAEGIPEALYEHLGQKLEPYLYASASLTDFFTPKAKSSPDATPASRKRRSGPAKSSSCS